MGRFGRHWLAAVATALLASCGSSTGGSSDAAELRFDGSPSTVDFGTLAILTTSQRTLRLSNVGTQSATQIRITLDPSKPFDFFGGTYPGATGNCGAVLDAGASCEIVLIFQPTLGGGYTTPLDVDYDDGTGPAILNGPTLQGTAF